MRVFITGLTGTLGTAIARVHSARGDQVWGIARSESRACEWADAYGVYGTLIVGDARDIGRQHTDAGRLLKSMDRLYHCAAMKHVDKCEQNPSEACRQNLEATMAVAEACTRVNVQWVFASSDKACLPENVYGASKLIGEQFAVCSGGAAVRLGNIIGSTGSVFQTWKAAAREGKPIRVTDPDMTRYFLPAHDAALLLVDHYVPRRVCVPRDMLAARMGDVASRLGKVEIVGARPGESLHQRLIAPGTSAFDLENVVVLDRAGEQHLGMDSATAPKWNVDDLLKLAGAL